jgi:hypothetical protein
MNSKRKDSFSSNWFCRTYESLIPEFAYSFGVNVEKFKVNDSFRKIKEFASSEI